MKRFLLFFPLVPIALLSIACRSSGREFLPFPEGENLSAKWMTPGINLIENSDFSKGARGWGLFFSGGDAGISYSNESAEIVIRSTGTVEHGVQFYYDGFRLYKGGEYTLSFTAESTEPKECDVRLQLNGGDYHAYAGETVTFDREKKAFTINFTMDDDSDVSPRLAFNMGRYADRDGALPVSVTISRPSLILNNNISPEEKKIAMIKTNQIGYRPGDSKIGYVTVEENIKDFRILDDSGETVFSGKLAPPVRDELAGEYTARADFSRLTEKGRYRLAVEGEESFSFSIAENVYDDLFAASSRFFYLQRCGSPVEDPDFGHDECHTGEARIIGTYDSKEADGGWHDAGDYGRYIVTGAKAAADLLLAWETSKDRFNGRDLRAEAKWELEWMFKMQREDGGVYHKVTCKNFPGFVMPEEETAPLFLSPVSTAATGDFAGVMAMGASYFKESDPAFSGSCLDASLKAWGYLETHGKESFKNPSTVVTGEYGDTDDTDERYFAAVALFGATGEQEYIGRAKELRSERWKSEFGWEQMEGYGDEIILRNSGSIRDRDFVKAVSQAVLRLADSYADRALNKSGYGIAQEDFVWGSNGYVLDKAHLLCLAADISGNDKYRLAARLHFDYVLGNNPMGQCYVTGFGTESARQPHHRPSIAAGKVMPGMLIGGPAQRLEDPFAQNLLEGKPPMKCWVDHYQSYSTNEIAINWNSALVYAIAKIAYGE